jgi:hypothetical protein
MIFALLALLIYRYPEIAVALLGHELYYGSPGKVSLDSSDSAKPSATISIKRPSITTLSSSHPSCYYSKSCALPQYSYFLSFSQVAYHS